MKYNNKNIAQDKRVVIAIFNNTYRFNGKQWVNKSGYIDKDSITEPSKLENIIPLVK